MSAFTVSLRLSALLCTETTFCDRWALLSCATSTTTRCMRSIVDRHDPLYLSVIDVSLRGLTSNVGRHDDARVYWSVATAHSDCRRPSHVDPPSPSHASGNKVNTGPASSVNSLVIPRDSGVQMSSVLMQTRSDSLSGVAGSDRRQTCQVFCGQSRGSACR